MGQRTVENKVVPEFVLQEGMKVIAMDSTRQQIGVDLPMITE